MVQTSKIDIKIENKIIKDILSVIDKSLEVLSKKSILKYIHLKELSNKTIHNASMYQDQDSLHIAVLMYALSKLIEHNRDISPIIPLLKEARKCLAKQPIADITGYRKIIKKLFAYINKIDKHYKLYIEEVIHKAKLKKATKLYEHGLSLHQSSNLLGISYWDLVNYIGKTTLDDSYYQEGLAKQKIEFICKNYKLMKDFVLDSSPIITLALNGILGLLPRLKKEFGFRFYITRNVKEEIVDKAMKNPKYRFEAINVIRLINAGILRIVDSSNDNCQELSKRLNYLANHIFYIHRENRPIKLVHDAELSALSCSITNHYIFVIDERITRMIIEGPMKLKRIMEKRLHTKLDVNERNLKELRELTHNITIIRSIDLVVFALLKGIFNYLVDNLKQRYNLLDTYYLILDALLWAMKMYGCGISTKELEEIESYVLDQLKNEKSIPCS